MTWRQILDSLLYDDQEVAVDLSEIHRAREAKERERLAQADADCKILRTTTSARRMPRRRLHGAH